MKRIIAVLLMFACVLGLSGCSDGKAKVWEWTQSLNQADIISATPWSQEKINQGDEFAALNDTQTRELVTLLNGLTKDSFTHNKHLRGGTSTYGMKINIAGQNYHLTEANGPHGSLEVSYNEKLWWIDSEELSAFVQRVTDSESVE